MVHIRDARLSNSNHSQNTLRMKDRLVEDDIGILARPSKNVTLHLSLYNVEGIGELSRDPVGFYYVVFSISPGVELWSPMAVGQPDPEWRNCLNMTLGDYPWGGNLKLRVEVVRVKNNKDPEPSTGVLVVGRVEIPLPKRLKKKKCGWFQLVHHEGDKCKAKGTIGLGMELLPFEGYGENSPLVIRTKRTAYFPY